MPYNMAVMEPRIQYAQTADGVSIAFWTLGEGAPLVIMPNLPFSHIQLEWQIPEYRYWYQRVAEGRKVVRYDGRGNGLSDRDVPGFSLDAFVMDLEAVVERLGLDNFALFASIHAGPVGITYAARRPERVSRLLLWATYARNSDILRAPQYRTLRGLMTQDWGLYTETIAHVVLGWSAGEAARQFAALMRESVTAEAAQAAYAATVGFDVAALLPEVKCPTLVLHRRQYPLLDMAIVRELATQLPDARLALLEGSSIAPFLGDVEAALKAVDDFLGEGEEATAPAAEPRAAGGMVTILFTDMEGSTALTQRQGDARAQEVLRTHNTIMRDALKAHAGSEIKHTGDGIMASFASASRALECAVAVQRAFATHNESTETPIRVRIGLNAGEPVAEEKDLFGTAVQLAARICGHAEPGHILAPVVVRELAAGKGFLFSDRGETALRGFEDPVRLYEVSWREG